MCLQTAIRGVESSAGDHFMYEKILGFPVLSPHDMGIIPVALCCVGVAALMAFGLWAMMVSGRRREAVWAQGLRRIRAQRNLANMF